MNSLRIILSEDAIQDLKESRAYIAEDNPDAAERFVQAAERVFEGLARTPFIGRVRTFHSAKLKSLRSWRIPGFENYLVFYRVEKDLLDIVRVIHGAMDLEQQLL